MRGSGNGWRRMICCNLLPQIAQQLSQVCPSLYPNPLVTQSQQTNYKDIISCFPQMKPEQKALELSEDEKAVLNMLKATSPLDLNELKAQIGLSNKKWDKAIKGLTKNKLAKVEKTDAGLLVSVL